jgi:two-component system, NarL family, nitrate/nitrite response regulator NarL
MPLNAAGEPTGMARSDRPVRVVLADDESLFRASLRQLLAVPAPVIKDVYGVDIGAGFEVVGEAATGEDAARVVRSVHPDLLLLDLCMPRLSGLDALRELGSCRDGIWTILLAGHIDRTQLITAVRLGVRGLLLKDAPTEVLFEAIMCVLAGQYWLGQTLVTDLLEVVRPLIQSSSMAATPGARLTPRERQVLRMVVEGRSNREIAREWTLSEETIKHHLTRMFDKLGAANRVELAMVATRDGLLDFPDAVVAPPRFITPENSGSTPTAESAAKTI